MTSLHLSGAASPRMSLHFTFRLVHSNRDVEDEELGWWVSRLGGRARFPDDRHRLKAARNVGTLGVTPWDVGATAQLPDLRSRNASVHSRDHGVHSGMRDSTLASRICVARSGIYVPRSVTYAPRSMRHTRESAISRGFESNLQSPESNLRSRECKTRSAECKITFSGSPNRVRPCPLSCTRSTRFS